MMDLDWSTLLYVCIIGFAITLGIFIVVTYYGIRFHSELPKLPIMDSIEALKLQKGESEAELEVIRETLYEARQTIDEAKEKQESLASLKQELEETNEAILTIGDKKAELDAISSALDAAQERLNDAEVNATQKKELVEDLNRRKEALQEDIKELKAQQARVDELRREIPDLEARAKTAVESLAASSKINEECKDEIAKLQEAKVALVQDQAAIKGDVEAKLKQVDQLNETIASLSSAATAVGAVPEGHDPCEDLWNPFFPTVANARDASKESHDLARMQQAIIDAGIKISTRTLHAFHTCLKAQDICPITVLAGISGTGKSLLPRVYSQCMGMHFLNLPTQPGWSSPQDLFGFYNYIEHKYKATPLARAMVQFDCYKSNKWKTQDATDLQDQVLLVLLDEMNLARIEYYFSELLSRLETRRTIDPDNEVSRLSVQIPLDIGHGNEKYSSINLYPGANVLFAGTMNEDESTLSLSDKVLDRSGVLRFGKPHEFELIQPNPQELPRTDPLAFSTWQQWCKGTATPEIAQDLIRQLGELMEEAGKPFAHRGGQAMARYVQLYPDKTQNGIRNAMADQIEQRILPKLRGLDLDQNSTSLTRLSTIAEMDLGDNVLAEAINRGLRSEQGMFTWFGIDRADE